MNLVSVNRENFNEVIELFSNKFYFLTTYPTLVSEEELKLFFLKNGITYLLENDGKYVGLAHCVDFELGYVFLKFKLKSYKEKEKSKLFFKEVLRAMKRDIGNLVRLEMLTYEFEKEDMFFFESLGLNYESKREDDVLIDNKLGDIFIYSLIEEEINDILHL
ncbi:hypothetical protein FC764_10150 [Clostridium botulinum]|nr:hypothetical protein [Clostridium botulinum]